MYRLTCQIKQASFEIKIYHQVFFFCRRYFFSADLLRKKSKKNPFFSRADAIWQKLKTMDFSIFEKFTFKNAKKGRLKSTIRKQTHSIRLESIVQKDNGFETKIGQ